MNAAAINLYTITGFYRCYRFPAAATQRIAAML